MELDEHQEDVSTSKDTSNLQLGGGGEMFKEMNLKMNFKLKMKRFHFVGPQGQYVLVID